MTFDEQWPIANNAFTQVRGCQPFPLGYNTFLISIHGHINTIIFSISAVVNLCFYMWMDCSPWPDVYTTDNSIHIS